MWDRPHTVSDLMTQPVAAVGERADFKEIVETMNLRPDEDIAREVRDVAVGALFPDAAPPRRCRPARRGR